VSDIKEKSGQNYLGLMNLSANFKKSLFELLYYYQYLNKILTDKYKLRFAPEKLSGVMGALSTRNDYIDQGCEAARLLIGGSFEEQTNFFENFDFGQLDKIVSEFKKVVTDIQNQPNISWVVVFFIWLRYAAWRRWLFVFAKSFLWLFLFLSILYFFVTTDLGRQLAWSFLDVYSAIVRILMVVLLMVAVVLIIGVVSFMYFEGKSRQK